MESPLAYQHTAAGGYAFAAYFMHALSWSIATNDAWLMTQVSAPTCRTCRSYEDAVVTLHKDGQTQRGGRPTIRSSLRLLGKLPYGAEVGIEFLIDESPAILLPSKRSLPAHLGVHSIVYLVWSDRGWLVREQAAP